MVLLWAASVVEAVTISGIMVYSTDDFGNPSGVNTQINDQFDAQMWRTLVRRGEQWHGLGVTQGLPPRSIDTPFLNFPNFVVDLALDEGENYFTLFGEPGPLTATDDYQRFAVNLYFDGDETKPGISVLFPRYADLDGATVSPSRANEDDVYSLTVQKVLVPPKTFYDDGVYRVSVLEASFLPPERASLSVDRVTPHAMTSGGTSDWVGTLTVLVEPSESFGTGGGAPIPAGGGGSGGGGRGDTGGAPLGGGGGVLLPPGMVGGPGTIGQDDAAFPDDPLRAEEEGDFWHQGDKREDVDVAEVEEEEPQGTPTPEDLVNALQRWLAAANAETPSTEEDDAESSDDATPAMTGTPSPNTPTAGPEGTPTADRTAMGSPTLASSPTPVVAATPTPGETLAKDDDVAHEGRTP